MKLKFIILFSFGLSGSVMAQNAMNNTGNLQIHTGASVTGFGDFTNASAGTFINNGTFYVKGTLSNSQSSMSAGIGTLYLNGSSAQSVAGSQIFKTYNLVTDNSAGITLNNDLSVSSTHTFTSGLINSSATPNYLVYESGSSYSGSSDSKHVNGWVKKIGSTDFTFPVGDATFERTTAISNLSAASEINCHYYTPTQNIYNLLPPVVLVKPNEYWQINKISGGSAIITLNWDHSKVPMDNLLLADILVAHYTGGNWTDAGGITTATGDVTTTGSVTSNAVNTFSPFTIGSVSFILPLQFLSFTGDRRAGTTFLQWVTENEQRVDYFEIQRSFNASAFVSIGNTAGRNSGKKELYNFEDHSAFQGIAYYRLRSVDLDGKSKLSRIVAVYEQSYLSNNIRVLNPAKGEIIIRSKIDDSEPSNFVLYNAAGKTILKGTIQLMAGADNVIRLPFKPAVGIYMLKLTGSGKEYVHKILID